MDYLVREFPKRHKNAFHSMTRDEFAAAIDVLRVKAGNANHGEMLVGLMQITAKVGDGHTRLNTVHDVLSYLAVGDEGRRIIWGLSDPTHGDVVASLSYAAPGAQDGEFSRLKLFSITTSPTNSSRASPTFPRKHAKRVS